MATVLSTHNFEPKTFADGKGQSQPRDSNPELPIPELGGFPDYLRRVAEGLSAQDLLRSPATGGFSLLEHACHLRDYEEEGCLGRIHRILLESVPDLADFGGEKLAIERNYRGQNFLSALEDFGRNRARTLELIQQLTSEQIQRTACLGSMGTVSIGRLIQIVADHDRTHKQEIAGLLKEMQEEREASSVAGARP